MKKNVIIIIVLLALCVTGAIIYATMGKKKPTKTLTKEVEVVPTVLDEISGDAAWCGTFSLVWNDLKNDLVKKDIVFNPQIKYAENLNKEPFSVKDISEEYYYKTYGYKTLELKAKIEKAIKDKFDQTSDVLDLIDWSEDALDKDGTDYRRYLFYTMLYREFEYLKQFSVMENDKFDNKYEDVKYFGLKDDNKEARGNIEILYYDDENDFAIKIKTKQNDELIITVNNEGKTFEKTYQNVKENSKHYKGNKSLDELDTFKMPYINFNILREYKEFQDKPFYGLENKEYIIAAALQSIIFELDEKGGKVKSEAVIDVKETSALKPVDKPKNLNIDKPFTLFIKEAKKDKPYLAVRIENITKFQKD